MPFDPVPTEIHNKTHLYRKRREAAAVLWRSVPPALFDMRRWECGSKACALGWLAHESHDGWDWEMHRGSGIPVGPDLRRTYLGAANYFGITLAQSCACFGTLPSFHRRWFISRVTPADVATTLLALPYTIKQES